MSVSGRGRDEPWEAIFSKYGIHGHDFGDSPYYLSAQEIKDATSHFPKTGQREVRILCYQAQRSDRPAVFERMGLFLLPVRNGKYAIVRGEGYIDIPEIISSPISHSPRMDFTLQSNLVGNSEMQHLDYAHASGMLEDFVGMGRLYLTIRGRKYTPSDGFGFRVGDIDLDVKSVQTEVDAGYEGRDCLVLVEGKNTKIKDTIIRQLYYPFRKWSIDTDKRVIPVFFDRKGDQYRFWMYDFEEEGCYNSIKLKKSTSYIIK